jgi:hypothetical protein
MSVHSTQRNSISYGSCKLTQGLAIAIEYTAQLNRLGINQEQLKRFTSAKVIEDSREAAESEGRKH